MQCGNDNERLTRLLHGELPESEKAEVEEHLARCADCREEWLRLRRIWGMLDELEVPEPSPLAQVRFDATLDGYRNSAEKESRRRAAFWEPLRRIFTGHPALALGYSVLLVIAGLALGYGIHRPGRVNGGSDQGQELALLTQQIGEMREMMMKSLLQNPSASERMRGVGYTSEIRTVNKPVIEALLSTLDNDPNINVRLMTLEALTHYAGNPLVREGLVQAILQQESPLMQAALADVMLRLQEKRAIRPFKKLLQQKELNGMVRTRLEETISRLS